MGAKLVWNGGGEGEVMSLASDAVVVSTTKPFAPGSRPEGTLASGSAIRVKTHRCRREPPGSEPATYQLEGRLISPTRALREELATSLRADGPHPSSEAVDP
jgi:hypothetical protein